MKNLSAKARSVLAPLFVLIIGFGASGLIYNHTATAFHDFEVERFESLSSKVVNRISERINMYSYGLRGVRGMLAGSEYVSDQEYRIFSESRDIKSEFPGALGMGYIQRVQAEDLTSYEARIQEATPQFTVKTSGDERERYIIRFIEPVELNTAAWGYDIGSERTRREAADMAMLTGEWSITGRIQLVQESRSSAGFLVLLPFYDINMPIDTPEQRRQALLGWTYAPLVMDQIMEGVLAIADNQIDFDVFDSETANADMLLYDVDNHLAGHSGEVAASSYENRRYRRKVQLDVGGRTWTIWLSTRPEFVATANADRVYLTSFGGIAATLLLTVLVFMQSRSELRATQLADEMIGTLRKQEAESRKLSLAASLTSDDVMITDAQGRIEWVNNAFTRLTGFTAEEAIGRDAEQLMSGPRTDHADIERIRTRVLTEMRGTKEQILSYTKTGTEYWHEVEVQPVVENSTVKRVIIIGRDITERRKEALALRTSEARFRAAIEGGFDEYFQFASVRTDDVNIDDFEIVDLNQRAAKSISMLREEVIGKRMLDLFPMNDQIRDIFQKYVEVVNTGRTLIEELHSSLSNRWLQLQAVRVGDGVAVNVRDISDRKAMEEQLRVAAQTDKLTELPNRGTFMVQLEQSCQNFADHSDEHFAVLFLDFDRFKEVNDTLGHEAGDQLLLAITRRICSTLRFKMREGMDHAPTVAARLGGDEFVVLARGLHTTNDAERVAERLIETLNRPYAIGNHTINSTASIGIATTFDGCDDAEELVRRADIAMYAAKKAGKARYVAYAPDMSVPGEAA